MDRVAERRLVERGLSLHSPPFVLPAAEAVGPGSEHLTVPAMAPLGRTETVDDVVATERVAPQRRTDLGDDGHLVTVRDDPLLTRRRDRRTALWHATSSRGGTGRRVSYWRVRVLVTNDDGVHAPGLSAITRALAQWTRDDDGAHEIVVVAPLANHSGASAAVGTVYEREAISYRRVRIDGADEVPTYG